MIRYQWLAISLSVSGLIGLQACSKAELTKSKDFVSVDANVKDNKFLLSLPELPGVAVLGSEAKMKIVKGHVKFPASLASCPNTFSLQQVPRERQTVTAPAQKRKPPSERIKQDGDVVAEMSIAFKAGQQLGPIMLAQGDYSINLQILERDSLAYFGAAQFSVESGVISKLDLKLQKPAACPKPDGGVVINPVIVDDKKSACDFVGPIAKECNVDSAFCEWKDQDSGELFSGEARCSIRAAQQNLIQQLCDQKITVGETFLEDIYCSAVPTEPPPPVKELNKIAPFKGTVIVLKNGEDYFKQDLTDLKEAAIIPVMGLSGDKITWSNSVNSKTIETILDGKGDYDNVGHYIDFDIKVTPEEPPVNTKSACEFSFGIPPKCDVGHASCEWTREPADQGGALGKSDCSEGAARQELVNQLCQSQVLVGEKFAEEINCAVIPIPLPPVFQENFKVVPFDGHFTATRDGQNIAVGDVKGLKEPLSISLSGAKGSSIIWKNSLNDKTIETVFDGTDKLVDFGITVVTPELPPSAMITSMSASEGFVGDTISFKGKNFSPDIRVVFSRSDSNTGEGFVVCGQNLGEYGVAPCNILNDQLAEITKLPLPQEQFKSLLPAVFVVKVFDNQGQLQDTGLKFLLKNVDEKKEPALPPPQTEVVTDDVVQPEVPPSAPIRRFAKVGVGFETGRDIDFNDHYACMPAGQFTVEGRKIISSIDQNVPVYFSNLSTMSGLILVKVFLPSGEMLREQSVFLPPRVRSAAKAMIGLPKGATVTFEVPRLGILHTDPRRSILDLNQCRSGM